MSGIGAAVFDQETELPGGTMGLAPAIIIDGSFENEIPLRVVH
jgi:hypothetical protein